MRATRHSGIIVFLRVYAMRLLVVGNGFSRLIRGQGFFINRHTAGFLEEISTTIINVGFAQPVREEVASKGLNDQRLDQQQIELVTLPRKRPWELLKALRIASQYDYFYIFFPGRWPRLIGLFALVLRKPFGIYVRGQQFSTTGLDSLLLKRARFICTVVGMEDQIASCGKKIIPIAPMIGIGPNDAVMKTAKRAPGERINLLFVGRVEKAKGVLELIDAAELLLKGGVGYSLKIVGGGPLLHELQKKVVERGLLNIEFLGPVSDKSQLMALYEWANAFVLPTHHEGFPRVLVEAMVKSCAIVTTFVGGIPSVMKAGKNCLQLPVDDAVGIFDAIKSLSLNPDLEISLSYAALATALDLLTNRADHAETVKEILAT